MKYIAFIFWLFPLNVVAQNGLVHYRQIINLNGKADTSSAVLRFNGSVSVYQYGSQSETEYVSSKSDGESSEHLKLRDEKGFIFYADHQKRIFQSREFLISKPVLVEDKFDDIIWSLAEAEGRIIKGRFCFPASGYFRGRQYQAWYDPSIKFPYGPWKLKGLPGMILQASSVDGVVQFDFVEYQTMASEILPPKERTKLSQMQYVNTFKRKLQSLEKFLKSNVTVSRTMNVQSKSKIHVLEISLYEN